MKARFKRIPRSSIYRGRGVTAAYRPFKPGGGGSNPSGPTRSQWKRRPVVQRENRRLITARWGFDSPRADSPIEGPRC